MFIPLSARLLAMFGWRTSLLVLAGLLAVVTIAIHALMLRRRPQDLGLLPNGEPATTADRPHPHPPESSTLAGEALSREPPP